jgi:hypothetical protein
MIDLIFIKKSPAVCRGFFVHDDTDAGVYAASVLTRSVITPRKITAQI